MKRLLTGTAIAALLAAPALAQTQNYNQTTEVQANSVIATEAELPAEYNTEDLNKLILTQLEKRSTDTSASKAEMMKKEAAANEPHMADGALHEDEWSETVGIVQTAQGDERFTTLVSLIDLSAEDLGLEPAMSYTVFAPVNDAFAPLSQERLDYLISDAGAQERVVILKGHIIPASITAADIPSSGTLIETLSGEEIWVQKTEDGGVKVGNAKVLEGDIEASNGVLHAVDTIIVPKGM